MSIKSEDKWALDRTHPSYHKELKRTYVDKAPTEDSKQVRQGDVDSQISTARKHLNSKYGNFSAAKAIKEHQQPHWGDGK